MPDSPMLRARAVSHRFRHRRALAAAVAIAAIAPSSLQAAPAGTLDAPWGGTGASTCSSSGLTGYAFCARAVAVLPSGKVLVGGGISAWDGVSASGSSRLYRLNADGTVDGTFPVVTVPGGRIYAIAVNAQGDIFVGGIISTVTIDGTPTTRDNIFALNADGTLKTSFNPNDTFGAADQIFAITPTADGGVIIGGESDTVAPGECDSSKGWCNLARLTATGALDESFTTKESSGSANRKVYAITPAPGGGYYIGGEFTKYKGVDANYVARINADGSRDTSFGGTGTNNMVFSIAAQGTQGVLIGGAFSTYASESANGLARARTDGTADAAFSAGTGWGAKIGSGSATVFTVGLDPAGRILVGGNFDSFGLRDGGGTVTPSTVGGFVGLNADGTSDSAFNTAVGSAANASGTGCDTVTQYKSCRVGGLASTGDSIFVAGTFNTFSGTSGKNSLVRLANDAKSVTVTLTGNGSVKSEPAGLDCGSVCTTYVREGGTVTLTATPAAGATFLGWGGACSGTALTCTVTLLSNQTVEARFSSGSGGSGTSGTESGGATIPVATAGRARVSPTGVVSVLVTTTGAGLVRIAGTRTPKAIACTARRTFGAAGSATMYCVPTRATRAKLRRGPVRVSLALVFTPTGGATTSTRLAAVTMPRIGSRIPAVTG